MLGFICRKSLFSRNVASYHTNINPHFQSESFSVTIQLFVKKGLVLGYNNIFHLLYYVSISIGLKLNLTFIIISIFFLNKSLKYSL